VSPGTRLVVAIAPALTMGFRVRSSLSSIAITELNGRPVLFTPSFSWARSCPITSQTRANTNGLDTLWIENSTWASPTENSVPPTPATQAPNPSAGAAASAGM
jgi:hypothetical protein